MSVETVIDVKNLSKSYRMYNSPSERLKELIHPFNKKYHQEFWALKDVSFEVKKGESVGIIGKNGSGKSTLLQLLCGVLQPTSGTVSVKGRVSALLELGAGFSPEFTGRDNVYMNGALMGISREEMDERFHKIAEFADIGDFIEQPVKTYSSGMYVRLAFACAVNVEPEILIVDEALSVGDEAFQRKCFSRIKSIQSRGGTILFVSHAASMVVELCNTALLIDGGELLLKGGPKNVVAKYHKLMFAPQHKIESLKEDIRANSLQLLNEDNASAQKNRGPEESEGRALFDPNLAPKSTVRYESRGAVIENPMITTQEGEQVNVLSRGEEYIYTYDIRFTEPAHFVRCGMLIKTITGFELGGILSHPEGDRIEYVDNGAVLKPRFRFRCALLPGAYFMNAGVVGILDGAEVYLHRCVDASMFRVQPEAELLSTGVVDFSPM